MLYHSKKIFVAVTNDVSTDQRVHKTCKYLVNKGYDVTVYGRILPDTFEVERDYRIIRKKLLFNNNFFFYAEYNLRLLWFLIFRRYDFIWSNDLDTLPACFIASKLTKGELIYDSHEYFTETPELQGRKFVQKIWLIIENYFVPKVKNAITVSEPIARILTKKYGVKFNVLRNLPELDKNIKVEKVNFPTLNKTVLYQGVLNPGRGIKPMIDSLLFLENIDLVIIGYGKVKEELEEYVRSKKLEKRVHFLGRIAHEKLHNYTKIADVGMVLEEPLGKSFEYSLPNKLFDFIHANIPIISSPLVEVKKIVEEYKIGLVINNYEPKHIASIVEELIINKELIVKIKQFQQKAKNNFCWENEVQLLDKFFKD